MNPIDDFRRVVDERLGRFPSNRYYLAGQEQLNTISAEYDAKGYISKATYDEQTLGVMCAREVEPIDMPFCDAAYAMLDYVRRSAR